MHLLIAFGRLDEDILRAANEAHDERCRRLEQSKGDTWVPEEALAERRASAPARGQVRGINHRTSSPKRLREKAKRAERELQQAEDSWRRGSNRWRLNEWSWWRWTQQVDDLWDRASWASQEAGVAYWGRDLKWHCNTDDTSFVALTIQKWREAREAFASSRGRQ